MENEVNMLMVFCAAIAALALGVLLGYVCCKSLFDVLRFTARLSAEDRGEAETQVARI
jgi:hypothetical protein